MLTPHDPTRPTAPPPDDLPPALHADLSRLYDRPISVPPDLDAEVLAAARERLGRSRRTFSRSPLLKIGGGLAAAACLGIVAFVSWPRRPATTGGPTLASAGTDEATTLRFADPVEQLKSRARGRLESGAGEGQFAGRGLADADAAGASSPARADADLNGDGRVDILDALALARAIRAGTAIPALDDRLALVDLDSNGRLDQRDVDAIAMLAVSLTPAPSGTDPAHGSGGGGS